MSPTVNRQDKQRNKEKGQAMAEFAMVMPIL
ncbi:pilus assembly protein, partial [Candidatus Parcubacteria bacterium]